MTMQRILWQCELDPAEDGYEPARLMLLENGQLKLDGAAEADGSLDRADVRRLFLALAAVFPNTAASIDGLDREDG